jgi:hypothetical protein
MEDPTVVDRLRSLKPHHLIVTMLAWLLSGNRTPSSTPGTLDTLRDWADAAQALSDDVRRQATARATGEVMLLVLAAIVLAHGRSNRR